MAEPDNIIRVIEPRRRSPWWVGALLLAVVLAGVAVAYMAPPL